MFQRLLIANRGEIAVRIARTCRELGVRTVAVYSDADRDALHVRAADDAICIGPASPLASYLDVEAILAAARDAGADALHPGYGFLAESADFADACAAAGLVFVGPSPGAMRRLGDKIAARRLAEEIGVPVLPALDDLPEDGAAPETVRAIGFPAVVKAAAGGGGRGMRLVSSPEELPAAIAAARREATAAFGDGRLLIERAVSGARHVEVQVIADREGVVVHLGERDCSIQRRHQKVIEEAPSPAVDAQLRESLGEAACRLAQAGGYENAGTVEFLLDHEGHFWFIEANTRLQVEHGVTELVTGLDLVDLQLRVAAGEPLPLEQDDVVIEGHAIECRLYAEDPARSYAPSSGRLERFTMPAGEGVRVDAGFEAGGTVPTEYDALLAKLMAFGPTRARALERMARALDTTAVEGVSTNLGLLDAMLRHPEFVAGTADLETLPAMPLEELAPRLPLDALAAAAAFDLLPSAPSGPADPWLDLGAWRVDGVVRLAYRFHGRPFEAIAARLPGRPSGWALELDGQAAEMEARHAPAGIVTIALDGERSRWQVSREAGALLLRSADGRAYLVDQPAAEPEGPARATASHASASTLVAPMHGSVLAVHASRGDRVRRGQPLVIIEAMKMEHAIEAPGDGVVDEVHCAPGDQVPEGALLIALRLGTGGEP